MNENYKKYVKFWAYFVLGFIIMFGLIKVYVYFFLTETKLDIWTVDNIAYLQWDSNPKPYTWKYKVFYPDTHIKQETWYFEKGKRNWEFKTYHPNWQVNIQANYIAWEKDWYLLNYNVDWALIDKVKYIKWKRQWKAEYFYDTWELYSVEFFKDDKLEWEKKEFYKDWKIKSIVTYKDDKKVWQEKVYTPDQKLIQDFFYSSWTLMKWKLFYEDTGKIQTDLVFDKSTWGMKTTEYDKNWKITSGWNPVIPVIAPIIDLTSTWTITWTWKQVIE